MGKKLPLFCEPRGCCTRWGVDELVHAWCLLHPYTRLHKRPPPAAVLRPPFPRRWLGRMTA
jgi:hypothetical protein